MRLQPPNEKRVHQLSIRLAESELRKLDDLVVTLQSKWNRPDIDRIDVIRSALEAAWQEVCASIKEK